MNKGAEQQEGSYMPETSISTIFQGVTANIQGRIQRPMEPAELAAVALVIGQHIVGHEDQYVSSNGRAIVDALFDTKPDDPAPAVAAKVEKVTYAALQAEIATREKAEQDSDAIPVIKQIAGFLHAQASEAYKNGQVCSLGTAPVEWPDPSLRPLLQSAMLQ